MRTLSTGLANETWAFPPAETPDLLFIYLGTNDFAGGCTTPDPAFDAKYTSTAVDFVVNATKLYGDSALQVVMALGPMSLCPKNATLAAVATLASNGYNATFLDMSPGAPCDGCWNHPGVVGHRIMFENARPVIASLLGW